MPLIANPAGVENEGKLLVGPRSRSGRRRRYEPRLAVWVLKASILKQTLRTTVSTPRNGPLHRLEILVLLCRETCEPTDIEPTSTSILQPRQPRMLVEYLRRRAVIGLLRGARPARGGRRGPPGGPGGAGEG